jgi:hypothetical protein
VGQSAGTCTFAEFEADLIRMRTREGMAVARAKGNLRGKQPKLSDKQQKELGRMHETGDYSISVLERAAAWEDEHEEPPMAPGTPTAGRDPRQRLQLRGD